MVEIKQDERSFRFMKVRLTGMIILLILEYILGMTVNILSFAPDDLKDHPSTLGTILLGAHGLVGVFLLIGAIFILIFSLRNQDLSWRKVGLYGFIGILLSFFGGIATVALKDIASNIGNFTMSIGFLLAFISYGRYLYLLKNR